jgi:hypothetical protein
VSLSAIRGAQSSGDSSKALETASTTSSAPMVASSNSFAGASVNGSYEKVKETVKVLERYQKDREEEIRRTTVDDAPAQMYDMLGDSESQKVDLISEINSVKYGAKKLTFQQAMRSNGWSERSAALNKIKEVLKIDKDTKIKLSEDDYDSLTSDLKFLFQNEKNLFFITKALRIVKALADGMGPLFSQYGTILLPEIIARFKEKKVAVLEHARTAADAVALVIKVITFYMTKL